MQYEAYMVDEVWLAPAKEIQEPEKQPSPGRQDKENPGDSLSSILNERGKRYGSFKGHAEITQKLKDDMREHPGWKKLSADQRECLDMLAHKLGRILNGDPDYDDSWVDIAGYAQLVANRLRGISM